MSLVKLHLSFLLRYLVFTRGPLQQNFVLLDSLNTSQTKGHTQLFSRRENPHLIFRLAFKSTTENSDPGLQKRITDLNPLELLPRLVHLPGVLVPLGVAAAERLLDLVKLLLDVLILGLRVLQLGPQPVDLALALLDLLLHLLHLHLGSLVVALIEPQLGLGAPQLVLGLVQLVLQLGVLHSAVNTKSTESKTENVYFPCLFDESTQFW